jgi:hypothetical protein
MAGRHENPRLSALFLTDLVHCTMNLAPADEARRPTGRHHD